MIQYLWTYWRFEGPQRFEGALALLTMILFCQMGSI